MTSQGVLSALLASFSGRLFPHGDSLKTQTDILVTTEPFERDFPVDSSKSQDSFVVVMIPCNQKKERLNRLSLQA